MMAGGADAACELGDDRSRPLPLRHLRGHDRADRARRRPVAARRASELLRRRRPQTGRVCAPCATLDEVAAPTCAATGYPAERLHFVEGKVEDTIPEQAPERIALLRLDTDWYESTRHELEHLYPRLSPGGVLIIDDYGHWEGARQAVDEYFKGEVYLHRIDYTGRLAIKP